MKYRLVVNVEISDAQNYHPLRLSEQSYVELTTLSDAAMILAKLHEFFEVLKPKGKVGS